MSARAWRVASAGVVLVFAAACGHGPQPPASLEPALLQARWKDLDKAAEQWSQDPRARRQALVLRGYAALMRGLPHEAESHFLAARASPRRPFDAKWAQDLAARRPNQATAQLTLGDALARAGDREGALTRLDAALAIDPNLGGARLARAALLGSSNAPEASYADLDRLASGGLLSAEARLVRAIARVRRDDWAGAFEDLDVALDLAPDLAGAYNARGVLRVHTGRWKTAAADFETGFQLEPALEECRQNGRLLQRQAARASTVSSSITIYVTDFGENSWDRRQVMMDDFSIARTPAVVPQLSRPGQVLVPMPERAPAAAQERQALLNRIAEGIEARIGSGRVDTFEVRITENVKGNRCAHMLRTAGAEDFGEIAFAALDRVKKDLTNRGVEVTMPAIMAGNAAYAFTEVAARMPSNPFDSVVLIRGCSNPESTRMAYAKMDGKLKIVYAAESLASGVDDDSRVAGELHARLPGLKAYSVEPGWAPTDYDPDKELLVRDAGFISNTPPVRMKAWGLLCWDAPPAAVRPVKRGGISLGPTTMVRTQGGGVAFQSAAGEEAEFLLVSPIYGVQLR